MTQQEAFKELRGALQQSTEAMSCPADGPPCGNCRICNAVDRNHKILRKLADADQKEAA